jgi:hypothetical protein
VDSLTTAKLRLIDHRPRVKLKSQTVSTMTSMHRGELVSRTWRPVRQGRGLLVGEAVLGEVGRRAEQELELLLAPLHRPEQALVDGAADDGIENVQGDVVAVLA